MIDPGQEARACDFRRFWSDFLDVLKLDDPEQANAKPSRAANIKFPLPVPNSWLSVYRTQTGHVGIFLSSAENTPGRDAMQAIARDFDAIKDELGGSVTLDKGLYITDWIQAGPLDQPEERQRVIPGSPRG